MARLSQGILGGISGKIGNVIGSSWKGIAIVKSKPLSVANPRTSGQIAQRTKMTNVVAFAKQILALFIKPLWDRFAQQASGYNDFVSQNIALFTSELPSVPSQFILSKGQMAKVNPTITAIVSGVAAVVITFPATLPDSLSLLSDDAYPLLVNMNTGAIAIGDFQRQREDFTVTCTFDDAPVSGDVIVAYLAFRRQDGTVVSGTGFDTHTVS